MATDIFSGTEVPRWLQEDDRPASGKAIGDTIGTGLAELLTSFQRDPDAPPDAGWMDSRKGPQEAAFEVRMAKQDPLWQAHFDQMKGQYQLAQASKWMQTQLNAKRLDTMDSALQTKQKILLDQADDNQLYSDTMGKVGGDTQALLDEPMPSFKTVQGRLRWQTAVNSAKASQDHLDAANNISTAGRVKVQNEKEFTRRLGRLDMSIPEVSRAYTQIEQEQDPVKRHDLLAQAEGLQDAAIAQRAKDQGLDVGEVKAGPGGTRTTYKAAAKTNLEKAQEYRDGIDPDLDPESYAEANKAVQKLTVNPLDSIAAREVNTKLNQQQRTEDRLKLMGQAQQYKIDLNQLQQAAKAGPGNKLVTEQQFIDRHLDGTRKDVAKNWDAGALGPVTTAKATAEAATILKRAYRWTNPNAGAAPAATPSPAPAASTAAPAKKTLIYDPASDSFK